MNFSESRKRALNCRFGAAVAGFVATNALILFVALAVNSLMPGSSVRDDVQLSGFGKSPMYGTWTWWSAHAFFEEEKAPDVVLLGSSLFNSAAWAADALTLLRPIDCAIHHRVITLERALSDRLGVSNPHVMNLSIGGAVASDYYVMSRALFNGERKPKIAIIGVAPRDFIDNKPDSPSSTEPFIFFSRYIDFDSTLAQAFTSPFERAKTELEWRLNKIPLRRFHAAVARILTDQGGGVQRTMPANQLLAALSNGAFNVRPGDIIVPFTVSDTWYDNTQEYAKRFKNPHPAHYEREMFFFEQTLKYLKSRDIKVLVVEMPTLPMNRKMLPDSFWASYIGRLKEACTKEGADFVELASIAPFEKGEFVDTVHVNWHGGIKVFNYIAMTVAKCPRLASSLAPQDIALTRRSAVR
ncbi:MAG TPA: hypothetical protein V6D17_19285 [Candidatus Obscuribacterales bacterium]